MSMVQSVAFVGGTAGPWRVRSMRAIAGAPLASVSAVDVVPGNEVAVQVGAPWVLRGVTSHARYVTQGESATLRAVQAGLGRPEATHAAMLPISKSEAWWALAQDERRAIFEERSRHVAGTLRYLPAISRRLHHGRDLGEPFDFVTWFEHAPEHDALFDELLEMLRATEEWRYVVREIDVRLVREDGGPY